MAAAYARPRRRTSTKRRSQIPREERENGPLLGALLRTVRRRLVVRILNTLASAGHGTIRDAHFAVFGHPPPRGVSPLELAERSQMSKQAMNQLLRTLERAGYVVRQRDPERPKRCQIWLTARGERAVAIMRGAVRDIERDFQRQLGRTRYTVMLAALRELAAGD